MPGNISPGRTGRVRKTQVLCSPSGIKSKDMTPISEQLFIVQSDNTSATKGAVGGLYNSMVKIARIQVQLHHLCSTKTQEEVPATGGESLQPKSVDSVILHQAGQLHLELVMSACLYMLEDVYAHRAKRVYIVMLTQELLLKLYSLQVLWLLKNTAQ